MMLGARIVPNTSNLVCMELCHILRRKDIGIRMFHDDFILFRFEDFTSDSVYIITRSRTIRNFYLVTCVFEFDDVSRLYQEALNVDWSSIFSYEQTFAVVPETKSIDRIEVGKAVGQGVVDSFLKNIGKRPRVNLSNPDIKILAKISGNRCVLAIDLIGKELNVIDDIASRLAVMACFSHGKFGEIYHSGICESFFEIANDLMIKERILDTPFVDLLNINQDKVLTLLSKEEGIVHREVFCYDDRDTKYRYPIIKRQLNTFKMDQIYACLSYTSPSPRDRG